MRVLDYSAGLPGAARIRAAGYGGAVRYIGFPDRRKCTNRAEFADFTANDLGMALVYEDNADDWRGGYNRGRDAGRRARDHATVIGFPAGRPIYMAVDRDVVTEAEFRVMVEYLRGASTELGGVNLTGVYGEHDVCVRAASAGVAAWFWQCRAWSGTPVRLFSGRNLYQHVGTVNIGGIACDYNEVLTPDWGQHNTTTIEEDLMSQAQYDDVIGRLVNIEGFLFRGGPDTADGEIPGIDPTSVIGRLKGMGSSAIDYDKLADALIAKGVKVEAVVDVAAIAKAVNDDAHARSAE